MNDGEDRLMSRYRPLNAEPNLSALERQAVRQALVILVVALFLGLGVVALQPDRSMLVAAAARDRVISEE